MRARAGVVAVLAFALAPACALFPSIDDLQGDDPRVDGSPNAEASTEDRRSVPPSDAPSGDAGVFRCSDHETAAFCADFETDPVDNGFEQQLASGGTFAAAPGRFGRGLAVNVPARPEAGASSAQLVKEVTLLTSSSFTYSYDVLIELPSGLGDLEYGGFHYNGPFYSLSLRSSVEGKFFVHEYTDLDGGATREFSLTGGPTPGKWSHVVFDVTLVTGGGSSLLTLTIDDVPLISNQAIGVQNAVGPPKFTVGIVSADGVGNATTITTDDVLVVRP